MPATGSFLYQLKTAADVLVDDQEPITGPATADLTPLIDASIAWPGSEAGALLGTAVPAGSTDAARAPGTGFFTLANPASVNFEATMWAEAGATATVGIYKTTAPDVLVTGSGLTSTHATGELKTSAAPITLAAGTYFIKGHSNHATLQAWAVTYRVSADT